MKNFLIQNWFKLGILLIFVLVVLVWGFSLIQKNNLEQQKQENVKLEQKQKTSEETLVNQCVTDAYTELKTLQANYDSLAILQCAKGRCDRDLVDESKKEAFSTYQNEWVPQCRLGNRVFLDYKYCSAKDMMNGTCEE